MDNPFAYFDTIRSSNVNTTYSYMTTIVIWQLEYSHPFSQIVNPRCYIVPPVIQYVLLISYLYATITTTCKGNSWITGGNNHLKKWGKQQSYRQNDEILLFYVNKSNQLFYYINLSLNYIIICIQLTFFCSVRYISDTQAK